MNNEILNNKEKTDENKNYDSTSEQLKQINNAKLQYEYLKKLNEKLILFEKNDDRKKVIEKTIK